MILPRRKLSATVPAMAMGDIAFLLLIFFVILARVQDDSHIQWKPAEGRELVKPEDGAHTERKLFFRIRPSHIVLLSS